MATGTVPISKMTEEEVIDAFSNVCAAEKKAKKDRAKLRKRLIELKKSGTEFDGTSVYVTKSSVDDIESIKQIWIEKKLNIPQKIIPEEVIPEQIIPEHVIDDDALLILMAKNNGTHLTKNKYVVGIRK